MTLNPQRLDEIDFWDLDMFSVGDPHAAWTLLRGEAPVWFHDREGGEPFYAITRYEDCRYVHANPRLFSSERDGIVLRDKAVAPWGDANPLASINPMIQTDPPRHQPLRRVVSHNFTPRAISRLEDRIRRYAVGCFDRAAQLRDVDFVTDVAHRIPAAIALSLMGVPESDWDRMAELEHITVTGGTDPEFISGEDRADALNAASAELIGYFAELVGRRREQPGEDLLSQFLGGRVDGNVLPWEQVVAEATLLLSGGLDTTRAAASAGMLPLLERPSLWEALQTDPSLLDTAVEEFVRWASPITHEARTVTADTELRGVKLREGDRVAVWSPSANRDEEVFGDPFTFDLRRKNNRHLGFAYGEHYCLGVHLARLTLRVEFQEIVKRFRTVEQTGEAVRVRSNFVGGLKHLPVRMTPR